MLKNLVNKKLVGDHFFLDLNTDFIALYFLKPKISESFNFFS